MAATTPVYLELFDRLLGIPKSTGTRYVQRLREDENVYRRGKQGPGAVEPTTMEVANLLIAVCATPSTGREAPDPLETVKCVRAAVRLNEGVHSLQYSPAAVDGLAIANAQTFGEAIDGLINDMRAGRFAKWRGDRTTSVNLRFIDHGDRIFLNFWRYVAEGVAPESAAMVFRNDDADHGAPCLTHVAELDIFVLEKIAEALGPMPAPD